MHITTSPASGPRPLGRILHPQANGWGGRRPGAGRKPKGAFAGVGHGPRPALAPNGCALLTFELRRGLPDLRRGPPARLLAQIFAAVDGRFGLHVHTYALYRDHLHLIVRARSSRALQRAMQGLSVRMARGLNLLLARTGPVFADRFDLRVLESARERRAAERLPCAWRRAPAAQGPHRPARCARLLPKRRRESGPGRA
jgi:hypothetical protein